MKWMNEMNERFYYLRVQCWRWVQLSNSPRRLDRVLFWDTDSHVALRDISLSLSAHKTPSQNLHSVIAGKINRLKSHFFSFYSRQNLCFGSSFPPFHAPAALLSHWPGLQPIRSLQLWAKQKICRSEFIKVCFISLVFSFILMVLFRYFIYHYYFLKI